MKNLRALDFDILKNVVSVYDQLKTTVFGTMASKIISGAQTLSPALMKYLDAVTDTTLVPLMPEAYGDYTFCIQGTATPFSVICYHTPLNLDTKAYVGRVNLPTGAGTSVLRAFKPWQSGVDAFISFLTTNATPANSGVYCTSQLKMADFTTIGTTLTLAGIGETSALKRVFKLEEDGTNGGTGAHALTAGNELFLDVPNGYLYAKNGTAATWQIYRFKYNVLLTSTSALGQTTSAFTGVNGFRTGNLNALSGTVLQNNSGKYALTTADSGVSATYLNQYNLVFATTTTIYHGLVSELAASITNWPSLNPINILGAAGDQVAPTAIGFFQFSEVLQRACFTSNGRFYFKRLVNNQFDFILGCTDTTLLEAQPSKFPVLGAIAITGMDIADGVLSITSSTVGQRGILKVDIRNEAQFGYSHFITPVLSLNKDKPLALQVRNMLRGLSSSSRIFYRTTGFGVATGNWVQLSDDYDLTPVSAADQIQFDVYAYISKNGSAIAPAINSLRLIVDPVAESDFEWVGSLKHTSLPGASPFYVAQRLQKAYSVAPAEFIVDIIDDSDNIVQSFSTIADAANFSYTTNDGGAWNALGTIPNVALTTELRLLVTSPPGGKVRSRIRAV